MSSQQKGAGPGETAVARQRREGSDRPSTKKNTGQGSESLSTRLTRQEKQAGVASAKEMKLERQTGVSLGRALYAK